MLNLPVPATIFIRGFAVEFGLVVMTVQNIQCTVHTPLLSVKIEIVPAHQLQDPHLELTTLHVTLKNKLFTSCQKEGRCKNVSKYMQRR